MLLAVIKTGGKQYLVKPGDKIKVEKLADKEGSVVKFDALLITDEAGKEIEVGKPFIKARVEAKILKQMRDKKIAVIKYKAKTRYNKNVGHRQPHSLVLIEKI